jgi:hypothetical protein
MAPGSAAQAVAASRASLPRGVSADEVANLYVEALLQALDVMDRLEHVQRARADAGEADAGSPSPATSRLREQLAGMLLGLQGAA